MSRKSRLLGFLLTAVFIWMVARNVSIEEFVAAFRDADYRLVAPAALLTFSGYLLRTLRWSRIVRPVVSLPFRAAFSILMMGFAANNLLPARLGEFVRAYLLRRRVGVRKTYGMATVILERICDGVTLIALLGAVSLLMPLPVWGQEVQMVSSLLFLGASAGVLLLLVRESLAARLFRLALSLFPPNLSGPLLRAADAFILGLHSLKSRRTLAAVVALSAGIWLLEAGSYLLMTQAFGVLMPPLRQALAAAFLLVVVNLGIMLPSAPGYVGTFQFFAVMALGAFGVPKETALAISISSHLVQYSLVTGMGLVFFARENVSFWSFEKEAARDAEAEEDGATSPAALG